MNAQRFASRSMAAFVAGFIFAAAATLVGGADAASPGTAPDATVTFRWSAKAAGVGFVWGASSVNYQGETYSVRVDGFLLGAIGTASGRAVGDVYGLSKIDDLNGNFTALTAGAALGPGRATADLRNAKGVHIVMRSTNSSGVGIGIGLRAITLTVGQAGGPPAEEGPTLPKTLGFGQALFGEKLSLEPTLNVQLAGFAEGNPGFNGKWSAGPVNRADEWFEHSNEFGLNAAYDTGGYGTFSGRASGVFSLTAGGVDAAASNGKVINNHKYDLEDLYIDWESGDLLPFLGQDALEISGGDQDYQLYDGLLFWYGAQNATSRGANWIAPRKAFDNTAIVRLNLGNLLLEGVHLQFNDDPDTGTRLAGERMEYTKDNCLLKHFKIAAMYYNIYHSDNPERNGLNTFYSYTEMTPLPFLPDFSSTGSFVYEMNSRAAGLTNAVGWYVYPTYQFSDLPWKPQLFYRYASFTGSGTRNFDPLFTGLTDWGTWTQGEILGEFVISNSNLISHQVRLKMTPNDLLTLNLIYYNFSFYNKNQSFGVSPTRVTSNDLGNELDTILDINLTNWWSMSVDLNFVVPGAGMTQAVQGHSTWIGGMIYENFNF